MRRVTLRALWEHKRRLISTVVAIVLGVAFMSGTFVLADTLDKVFDDLFAEANEGVDAQVQGVELFESQFGGSSRQILDQDLVDTIAAVDGVRSAVGVVDAIGFGTNNRILDSEGERIGASTGPPTLLETWVEAEELNPYRLVGNGRGPRADDEVALNVAAADEADFELGDTVTVVSQLGRTDYTLVGVFTFGEAESAAGATTAEFTRAEAQRLAGLAGQVEDILVSASDGVGQDELVDRIAPVLDPDVAEVITGEEAAAQISEEVQSGFAFFQQILTIFGTIALLVGIFIISNTFAILVSQRTRELALLRAIGASRAQVLRSVLLEAVVIGLVAAVLGLLGGIALAFGVRTILEAVGADLPGARLIVGGPTIAIAFVTGLGVTIVSAVVPAIRATRVPPLAALRDVSIDRAGASRVRIVGGALVVVLSALALVQAWGADGDTDVIPTVGLGALLLVVGAIVVGPVLAGPTVRILGAALPRLRGVTGQLATENAARSPKRTSATASALVIGVALIGFITVFAASARESISSEIDRSFSGDLIVQAETSGFGPPSNFPVAVGDEIAGVDGVDSLTRVGFTPALFTYPDGDTATQFLTSVEPATFSDVLSARMETGDVRDLTDDGILVDRQIATDNDLAVGDVVGVTGEGGTDRDLIVQGISDDTTILGFWVITRDTYAGLIPDLADTQIMLKVADGADLATVTTAIEDAIAGVPGLEVLDRDGFVGDLSDQITQFLNFIYGLLGLSVLIAMIGIANTLSLSIHERTRELGLLRAVGMERQQLRSSIRWEAVIIAVLGTLVGLGLGVVISLALVKALEGFGITQFAVPGIELVVLVLGAAALAILASVLPARRAARMNVLDAIATE